MNLRLISLVASSILLLSAPLLNGVAAQTQPESPPPAPQTDRADRQDRRNFDPAAMRDRMLNALREQLGVETDDEWAIIKERVAKVTELRQNSGANPLMGFRALAGGASGGGQNRRAVGGAPVSPEITALVDAVHNKATDAEIQSRLAQLRAVRKKDEALLAQAQEDLRAVLTVRQEAIAVVAGLLP